jgi:hypothetical protein
MTLDLARLRELAEKARPGPWRYSAEDGALYYDRNERAAPDFLSCCNLDDDTMEYVAAANPTAVLELLDRLEALRAALEQIAVGSPPDDWDPYDTGGWGGYDFPGYGQRGAPDYVDAPDDSNYGDMHAHGRAVGRWEAAKAARAALAGRERA